jgi:hypothetical protein
VVFADWDREKTETGLEGVGKGGTVVRMLGKKVDRVANHEGLASGDLPPIVDQSVG